MPFMFGSATYFAHAYILNQYPHYAPQFRYLFYGLFYAIFTSPVTSLLNMDTTRYAISLAKSDETDLQEYLAGCVLGYLSMFAFLYGLTPKYRFAATRSTTLFHVVVLFAVIGSIVLWTVPYNDNGNAFSSDFRVLFFNATQSIIGTLPILSTSVYGQHMDGAHAAVVLIAMSGIWYLSNIFYAKSEIVADNLDNSYFGQIVVGFVFIWLSNIIAFASARALNVDVSQKVGHLITCFMYVTVIL